MSDIEKRLTELEEKVGTPTLSIEQRLECVEQKLQENKCAKKDFWDKFKVVAPFISAIVVIFIAYYLTDSVKLALQERQLELSNVKAMQELMVKLSSPDGSREEKEATAVTLATFGNYAVVPLINELQAGGVRTLAASQGLRSVGFTHKDLTCKQLAKVLKNRNGVFAWKTHQRVIGLLGEIDCRDQVQVLKDYNELVEKAQKEEGLKSYKKMVKSSMLLNLEKVTLLKDELDKTIEALER